MVIISTYSPIEHKAATLIQNWIRCINAATLFKALIHSVYEIQTDIDGNLYYYNAITGSSSWEIPYIFKYINDASITSLSTSRVYEETVVNEKLQGIKRKWKQTELNLKKDILEKTEIRRELFTQSTWSLGLRYCTERRECILNWKGFHSVWGELFLYGKHIKVLRFIGNPIQTIPSCFAYELRNLQKLSMSNCGLKHVPGNIVTLQCLKYLNLMKNKISVLPFSIGRMRQLQDLKICNNCIREIPTSFGKLKNLKRVNLEKNNIKKLPTEITNLKCKVLILNKTRLLCLPENLQNFSQLIHLSACNNSLKEIPSSIGELKCLESLLLSSNYISNLPASIGNCKYLKRLWIDWNCIQHLPHTIFTMDSLSSLSLEGNPLKDPDINIVNDGIDAVKLWAKTKTFASGYNVLKKIIIDSQCVLRDVIAYNLSSVSKINSGNSSQVIGHPNDRFFVFVESTFFEEMIPSWEKHLSLHEIPSSNSYNRFPWTREDVLNAFQNFEDAYGKVALISHPGYFTTCSCIDENGMRRVCVPPKRGYMCQRSAVWLKEDVVTRQTKQNRCSHESEERAVIHAKEKARRLANSYVNSKEGKEYFVQEARYQAQLDFLFERFEMKKEKKLKKINIKETKHRNKLLRRQKVIERRKKKHIARLEKKKKMLTAKKEMSVGWEYDEYEEKILDIEDELDNLSEDADLNLILFDREKGNEEYATLRKRVLDSKFDKSILSTPFFFSIRSKTRIFKKKQDLIYGYIESEESSAAETVRREYRLLRTILCRWSSMQVKRVFTSWKQYVSSRKNNRKIDDIRENKFHLLIRGSEENKKQLIHIEEGKWKKKVDVFSDASYWEHSETGEIKYTQPEVHNFIPHSFPYGSNS